MTDRDAAMREALEMAAARCDEWATSLEKTLVEETDPMVIARGTAGVRAARYQAMNIRALAIPAPEPAAPPQQAGVPTEAMVEVGCEVWFGKDQWRLGYAHPNVDVDRSTSLATKFRADMHNVLTAALAATEMRSQSGLDFDPH